MSGCRLKLVTVQTVPDRGILRARVAMRLPGPARIPAAPRPAPARPHRQVPPAPGQRCRRRMQLLLPLPGQTDDTILAQAAAARGTGITALSPLHLARSPDRRLLLGFGRLPDHKIPAAVDALWSVLSQAGAASIPAAARHVADQPGDPPRLEVRQPAIRSDRADMWPGLPTATNTVRPTESFSTNRKLTSRDSCPLSAVLVRPVRVAYIRILAAWRCCGSCDMTARPPVTWGTPDPRRGRAVLLAGRDAVRPRLTSLRRLCRPWLRACRRRAESRPAASCRRRPGC
jgi:hypothetical protein